MTDQESERMGDLYFEDFFVGRKFTTDSVEVSEAEIVEFAQRFAPLPYHTDPEASKATMYGGVIAAGYHTAAITFGLWIETGAFRACGLGSPGVDKLRWLKPVRPGDTLHVVVEVIESSPAPTPGGRDAIRLKYDTINQNEETVMTLTSLHFVKRRPA
ncbi:MAG: MaoC family dehydratase [Rhodospirillales bacterium]